MCSVRSHYPQCWQTGVSVVFFLFFASSLHFLVLKQKTTPPFFFFLKQCKARCNENPPGLNGDSSGPTLVVTPLSHMKQSGVFWRKWKRKGTDKHQRIQCTERKASHRGLVKSIKGPIHLWNFLSQPISARSGVNKPPGLSIMHIWLLIAANWQFTVRLWPAKSSVVTAKQHAVRWLGPNGWLHLLLFPPFFPVRSSIYLSLCLL